MAQIIKIKGSKTNASAIPSSLVERELASNLVDRCLFGSDGTSVFKYYTGSTKYFDANGYANNANKLGGQTIDYFASADGVADALDEIIDSLKGYQPLITSTNKLAYSLISGVPTSLKNPNALTFGSKTYDGSAARTILASDLGALTAHQTIYALTIKNSAGTTQLTYTPNSAVGSLTLTKSMVGLSDVENTALSTWVGTNKITTLGTITTGVWNGTKIANSYLANSAITIVGTSVSLGGSITAATLQSNLGLGSFAYKSILAFADLTNKPTTISGYGITDAYTKSQVDSALGGYLPLSGGTITGSSGTLSVARTDADQIGICFKGVSGVLGYLGFSAKGIPAYIEQNGTAHNIIHSGNIGSQSVLSAEKLVDARGAELVIYNSNTLYVGGGTYTSSGTHILGNDVRLRYGASAAIGLLLNSSGNVGIGSTNPQYKLDVNGSLRVNGYAMGLGGAIDFQFSDEINRYGGNLYLQHRGDGSQSGTGGSVTGNVVMCKNGGNVLIGTSTDNGYKLDINGTLHASGVVSLDSVLAVGGATRIDGNVAIGNGSDGNKLYVYGIIRSAAYNAIGNNSAAFVFDKPGSHITGIGANGVADTIYFGACNTSGAWVTDYYQKWHFNGEVYAKTGVWSDGYVSAKGQNTSSDMRLKNVLGDVVLSVKDIANAPSIRFSWKNGGGVDVGSSAQYWQGLLPDAVKERDGMLEMQYANIALLSAIALAKNFETMEQRVARLEKENIELKNKIDMMERRNA